MTTTRELLDRYNVLAAELGAPHLNTWKAAKEGLQIRVNDLEHRARMAAAAAAVANDTVTLACIARAIGIAPKDARAKARRHADEFGALEVARHTYQMKNKDDVIALLTRDHRKS
jgi:predicted transcriptional regulator